MSKSVILDTYRHKGVVLRFEQHVQALISVLDYDGGDLSCDHVWRKDTKYDYRCVKCRAPGDAGMKDLTGSLNAAFMETHPEYGGLCTVINLSQLTHGKIQGDAVVVAWDSIDGVELAGSGPIEWAGD